MSNNRPVRPTVAGNKNPRRPSNKRYTKAKENYETLLRDKNLSDDTIKSLKENISTRKSTVFVKKPGGKEEEISIDLRPAQITDLVKQLYDERTKNKRLSIKVRNSSSAFKNVSKKTIEATKVKYMGMYEREKLALEADRNMDSITKYVKEMIKRLSTTQRDTIKNLRALAISDGRKFNLEFNRVLRSEVKNKKFKAFITVSPKIQGALSRMARQSLFGYKKK